MHSIPVRPSGRFIGRITLSPTVPVVRAGDLVPASPYPQEPDSVTLYRFLITSHHALTIGYRPGDEILIDTSILGYWNSDDYDNHVVLVSSKHGPILGRYHLLPGGPCLELLDGSGAVLSWTDDMDVVGLVDRLWLWARREGGRATFL